jgi:hypothetical protein
VIIVTLRGSILSQIIDTSRAFPKFESYGMPETAAFRERKAQDAIEWFHGIGRLASRAMIVTNLLQNSSDVLEYAPTL